MVRKMLINDVIAYLRKRDKSVREVSAASKKGLSSEQNDIDKLKAETPKRIYLEEDCAVLRGGGLKRGHLLTLEEARSLKEYGFYIIWVTDKAIPEDKHKKDIIYYYKTELENILTKTMVIIEEKTQGRKPGSTINYIEQNDLLRQTIESLQRDGARYIKKYIFGDTSKKISSIEYILNIVLNKNLETVGLFDSYCLGNLWELKQRKAKKTLKNKERVRSNFILRFMLSTCFSFIATMTKIQKKRLSRKDDKQRDYSKRALYTDEEIMEGSLSALFAEYGYLHQAIDLIMLRNTNPYYSNEGQLEGSGFTYLDEANQFIVHKHSNVSNYIFTSDGDSSFASTQIGKDILRNHHRYLNDTGYPKRKVSGVTVSTKDEEGNFSILNKKVFDVPILEMTRLVGIASFFIDCLAHTPLHVPFQRDSIVRHIKLNSVYNTHNKKADKEGIYDIDTHQKQAKCFDAYLVDCFLSSITIYKIGEEVPIYNFNNSKEILYDAVVIKYNALPNRPTVRILNGENKEIDLSKQENNFLYIGEYIPSLIFQDVIDKFYLDYPSGGISIKHFRPKHDAFDIGDEGLGEEEQLVNAMFGKNPEPANAADIADYDEQEEEVGEEVGEDFSLKSNANKTDESIDDEDKEQEDIEILDNEDNKAVFNDKEVYKEVDKVDKEPYKEAKEDLDEQSPTKEAKEEPKDAISKKSNLFSIFIKVNGNALPYGLGELISKADKEQVFRIKYMAQFVSSEDSEFVYRYVSLSKDGEQTISVLQDANKDNREKDFVTMGVYRNVNKTLSITKPVEVGSFHMLYYIASLDPANKGKNNLDNTGIPKYIVEIKEKDDKSTIVQFVRYILIKEDNKEFVKDQNCGKRYDINKMPFFKLGSPYSLVELARFLSVSIS